MSKLRRVLLIDDYEADNFLHKMLFEELDCAEHIDICWNGREALDFLTTPVDGEFPRPNLICLDINMPIMGGWDFLEEYRKLPDEQTADVLLMMLTTSENPDDEAKALASGIVAEYQTKPLNARFLKEVINNNFPGIIDA